MRSRNEKRACNEKKATAWRRVWIVGYSLQRFQPADWRDVPPGAVAIEPAECEPLSPELADRYVEAFNRAMLAVAKIGRDRKKGCSLCEKGRWAVAVPVAIRYDGEPRPGEKLLLRR